MDGVYLITPYDRDSVMHYEINNVIDPMNVPATSTCNLGNDNGSTGLSYFDQLTLRILYPHDARVAEFRGTTAVRVDQPVVLKNEWGELGALVQNVVINPRWEIKIPGRTGYITLNQYGADFNYSFVASGSYLVVYSFDDMLGRTYSNGFTVSVVSPSVFDQTISARIAAGALLM